MRSNIILTGGGTGGHIIPNMALIPHLKNYFKHIHYIGDGGMDKELVLKKYPFIIYHTVPSIKFKRTFSLSNLAIPFKLGRNTKEAKCIIRDINPSLVFSKGGYVSLPVMLACTNYPLIIHESDNTLGLANRLGLKNCDKLLTAFSSVAKKYDGIHTGLPINEMLFHGKKELIDSSITLKKGLKTILIMCGSQGSQVINNEIINIAPKLCQNYNVIHITGQKNISKFQNKNYFQLPFSNNMEDYYAASDLIISRGGANTLFEIVALKKPAIVIPLPKSKASRGDQVYNAKYFEEKGCIYNLAQNKLNSLYETISSVFENSDFYINNCKKQENINGTQKIIDNILSIAK